MNATLLGLASLALAQPTAPARGPVTLRVEVRRGGGAEVSLALPPLPGGGRTAQVFLEMALGSELTDLEVDSGSWGVLLRARAPRAFSSRGWSNGGEVRLRPLVTLADLAGAGGLAVRVRHPRGGFLRGSPSTATADHLGFTHTHQLFFPPGSHPPPLRVEFGYEPRDAWRLVPLAVALVVPLLLTLMIRQRALREMRTRLGEPEGDDPFAVWFRHGLVQRRLLFAFWVVWFLLLSLFDVPRFIGFTLGNWMEKPFLATTLFALVPPALVVVGCSLLSARVSTALPALKGIPGRLLRRRLWLTLALVGIGAALAWTADRGASHQGPPTVFLYVATGLCIGLALRIVGSHPGGKVDPLPDGELQQRIREMADDFGAPVFQTGTLAGLRWRLMSVLYPSRAYVFLPPEVLPHLTRREVDALVAHQLAEAYFARTLGWWFIPLSIVAGVGIFFIVLAGGWYNVLDFSRWWPVLILVLGVLTWAARSRHRRLSPRGDVAGAALTGDPEAMLTALDKLRRLGLVPFSAAEPDPPPAGAPWPRLEALANRARIPPEQLAALLSGPGSGADSYPPLAEEPGREPDKDGPDDRAFSTRRKRRVMVPLLLAYFLLQGGLPALAVLLAQLGVVTGGWAVLLFICSAAGAFILVRLLIRAASARVMRRVRRELADRLRREGLLPDESAAEWVGLSPGPEPRIHDGFYVWDLGFLLLTRDHLHYLGDRTRFTLLRALIRSITLGPGPPAWRRLQRVYLRWEDEERGEGDTVLLNIAGPASEEAGLARRLQQWREEGGAGDPLPGLPPPGPIPNLGIPSKVTRAHLVRLGELFLTPILPLAANVVLDLPEMFRWLNPLWYGIMAYAVLDFLHLAPTLFRRPTDGQAPDNRSPP
jgi:hypothetical protein